MLFRSKFYYKSQTIPGYSSVKHNGSPLYKYARVNINILKLQKIKLYNIKLLRRVKNMCVFDIVCSKGAYIRSVVNDISLTINLPLSVYKIIRLSVENISVLHAYDLKSY